MKPLKACRMKCKERFSDEDRDRCFQDYWNLGREYSYQYSILIAGIQKAICKSRFIATFGETKGSVEIVGEKKKEPFSGIIPPIDVELLLQVIDARWRKFNHILSFPKYESHYCRNRTSKKFV